MKYILLNITFLVYCFSTALSIERDSTIAQDYINRGWELRNVNLTQAILTLDSGRSHISTKTHPITYSDYISKKGVCFAMIGEPDSAFQYFKRGLEIRLKYNLTKGIAKSYMNIGVHYWHQDKIHEAFSNYEKGKHYALKANDSISLTKFYANIGSYYDYLEQYDSAIFYYTNELEISKRLGLNLSSLYINLGSSYFNNLDYKTGISYSHEAIKWANLDSNHSNVCLVLKNIGDAYENQNKIDSSSLYYHKALKLATRIENHQLIVKCNKSLFLHFKEQNDFKKALEHYETYANLEIENERKNADAHLLELQTQFETKEKNAEIELLTKNNRIQDQEIELKNKELNQQYLLSAILAFITLSLIGFYLFIRQKQRTQYLEQDKRINNLIRQKEMERVSAMITGQEKERKRIAEALHDQIGSLLSTVKHYLSGVDDSEKNELIYKAEAQLDHAVQEMRRISHNLVSGVLVRFGLIAAVKDLANAIRETGKINVKVITTGFDERINSDMEIYIYRILQELITNILKHADCTELVLKLKQDSESIFIRVQDNGAGFNKSQINPHIKHWHQQYHTTGRA